jgi:hypothetical protein
MILPSLQPHLPRGGYWFMILPSLQPHLPRARYWVHDPVKFCAYIVINLTT